MLIRTAWKAPHRAPSLYGLQEHSPATKEEMEVLAKKLYSPIHSWQTRILKILLSPSDDGPMECELCVATFGAKNGIGLDATGEWVQFDALSYTWGWPNFTVSTRGNGLMIPTTRHLAEALHYFRYQDHVRYLWTDAFCINQYDLEEKGLQVQLIFEIFGKAETVLGWLGPSTDSSYRLFSFIVASNERRSMYPSQSGSKELKEYHFRAHDERCQSIRALLQNAILELVETNAWFSRTWTRQEVAAARNLEIFAGFYHFPVDCVVTVKAELGKWRLGIHQYPHYPPNLITFLANRKERLSWSKAFFTNAEGFQAGVDHDRVYALQNIVEGDREAKDRLFPVVSYDKPASLVYEEMIKRLWSRDGISLLNVFENYARRSQDPNLASWVPDPRVDQPRLVDESPWLHQYRFNQSPRPLGGPGRLRLTGWKTGSLGDQSDVPNWKYGKEIQFPGQIVQYGNRRYGDRNRNRLPDGLPYKSHHYELLMLSHAMQSLSYTFYKMKLPNDSVKCGDVGKHETNVFATSIGRSGDLIVFFQTCKYHYLLRPVGKDSQQRYKGPRTDSTLYKFLGPCIVMDRNGSTVQRPIGYEDDTSSWLSRSVKAKLHVDCWKDLLHYEQTEFVMV